MRSRPDRHGVYPGIHHVNRFGPSIEPCNESVRTVGKNGEVPSCALGAEPPNSQNSLAGLSSRPPALDLSPPTCSRSIPLNRRFPLWLGLTGLASVLLGCEARPEEAR